jgi:hypothetical protein
VVCRGGVVKSILNRDRQPPVITPDIVYAIYQHSVIIVYTIHGLMDIGGGYGQVNNTVGVAGFGDCFGDLFHNFSPCCAGSPGVGLCCNQYNQVKNDCQVVFFKKMQKSFNFLKIQQIKQKFFSLYKKRTIVGIKCIFPLTRVENLV